MMPIIAYFAFVSYFDSNFESINWHSRLGNVDQDKISRPTKKGLLDRLMNIKARCGAIYFITLIDDYSRHGYVYLLSHCYKRLDVFKRFLAEVETRLE